MNPICPKCMEEQPVAVSVADGETLTCPGCDESYSAATVRELVASWGPLLAWLDAFPRPAAEVRLASAG